MCHHDGLAGVVDADGVALGTLGLLFPISQPQPRSVLTTFGSIAAVKGTRMKMKDLWMAYARANCVQKPGHVR